jgi:hypothetical protein
MKTCREEGSTLRNLFFSSLGLNSSLSEIPSGVKFAALNALSIGDRGREELISVRHSLNFMRENLRERIELLQSGLDNETPRTDIIYIKRSLDTLRDLLDDCEMQRDQVEMLCRGVNVAHYLVERTYRGVS